MTKPRIKQDKNYNMSYDGSFPSTIAVINEYKNKIYHSYLLLTPVTKVFSHGNHYIAAQL